MGLPKTKEKPSVMQMTLEKASKTDMIRQFSNLSLDNLVQDKYPSISNLSKYYGIEKTEKAMQIVLLDLSDSFGGDLSKDDVEEISVEVSSSIHKNLSLEDIYFICREIKSSKVYGKLSVNTVLTHINEHMDKKTEKAAAESLNIHMSTKEGYDPERNSNSKEMKAEFHQAKLKYLKEKSHADKRK